MAIYGFGAAFGGTDDMTSEFIRASGAFVGWKPDEAPAAHAMLKQIEVGDLVFLKSFPPSVGLIVKAAGIVIETDERMEWELGTGVTVRWIFRGEVGGGENIRLGKIGDKADFTRGGTLYREYNPDVQRAIIVLLLGP
ncbi:MAG: hypothetical protein QOH81_1094 [Sphingomonadales bacterium]|jgi:hypothetical protein|nr:hypothetical protein [Sphingomonadales bacterium]